MESRRTLTPEHNKHDRVLVARFAAGDAYPTEVSDAKRLVDGCDECAALAADIKLISARTSELPAPQRSRDFRITPEQADLLRGSWFERLMRGFSAPGWAFARPLAGAALAIGLAFVVIGALPLGNLAASTVTDTNPGFSQQAAGVPTSLPAASQLPLAATQPSIGDSKGGVGPVTAPQATQAPEFGGQPTSVPGIGVDVQPTMPRDTSSSPESPANVTQESAPPPPKPVETSAPAESPKAAASSGVAQSTPNVAYVVPTAAPTPPPPHDIVGSGSVSSTSLTSFDRTALVAGGLLVAFLALMLIGLITVARRRYSDPLVR